MIQLLNRIIALPVAIHLGLAAAAIAVFTAAKSALDRSYADSGHPVDYATGQLAFSAEKIAEYYRVMTNAGTLPVYWKTQFIDFGFMAAVAMLGVFFGSLAARLWPAGHRGRTLGLSVPVLAVTGASFDAIENLLSFWMLSAFPSISKFVALAYSSAAAVKFFFLTCSMFGFVAIAVIGAARLGWIATRRIGQGGS